MYTLTHAYVNRRVEHPHTIEGTIPSRASDTDHTILYYLVGLPLNMCHHKGLLHWESQMVQLAKSALTSGVNNL